MTGFPERTSASMGRRECSACPRAGISGTNGCVRLVVAETDHLGDCPTWDEAVQRLLWIDIIGKRLSSCAPDGSALERQFFNETPGSFALRKSGGLLVGFRRRLALFDPAGVEIATLVPDAANMNRERFNDGACDCKGRFWIG